MLPSLGVWLSRCCAYQGSFRKSSKSVVNSLSISAKVPVFQGFAEIIKVVGITIKGRDVAIYKEKATTTFCGAHRLNTNAYIISTNNMRLTDTSTFDRIEFRGGTLSKAFSVRH